MSATETAEVQRVPPETQVMAVEAQKPSETSALPAQSQVQSADVNAPAVKPHSVEQATVPDEAQKALEQALKPTVPTETTTVDSQHPSAEQQASPREAAQPFFVTAQTPESLQSICRQLIEGVDRWEKEITDDKNLLRRIAHGLAASQEMNSPILRTFTADSLAALRSELQAIERTPLLAEPSPTRPIVLVFAGQFGNKVVSKEIYDSSAIFRWQLDECDRALKTLGLNSLYPSIFEDNLDSKNIVDSNCRLFSIQYASARTWMESGLQVSAVMGYSFGQITAWAVSGIMSLKDALRIASGRAKSISERCGTDGAMIGVLGELKRMQAARASLEILHPGEKLEIACVSGPGSYVLVGREPSVAALEGMLPKHEFCGKPLRHKRVEVTHGFHSELMDPMLDDLRDIASKVEYHKPVLHFEACSEEPQLSVGPEEVVRHTRGAVYFEAAVTRISEKFGDCAWVEVDAGQSAQMTNMMRRITTGSNRPRDTFHACNMDPSAGMNELAQASVGMWKDGITVQHWGFHRSRMNDYLPIALPAYQFARRARRKAMRECAAVHESLGTVKLDSPAVRAAKTAVQESLQSLDLGTPVVEAAKELVQESLQSLKMEIPDEISQAPDAEAPKTALQESLESLKLEAPEVETPETAVQA